MLRSIKRIENLIKSNTVHNLNKLYRSNNMNSPLNQHLLKEYDHVLQLLYFK
jgi:hypothetical protein